MSKEEKQAPKPLSREEKLLRGTAWSTLSDFVSRLMGALYIIPWYAWMGKMAPQANALYGMGYNVYGTILAWSTMGLNVAIAKQIGKYTAIDEEEKGLALTRSFLKLMVGVGAVAASVMYFGAPVFSQLSGAKDELVPVFRSLTLAVFAYPAMSVIRGVFQGYNNMKPNALSQMLEQLVRVIWMLVTAFVIMKLGSKDYITAVSQSTFAAFIGMLASFAVLLYYLWKDGLLIKLLKPSSQPLPAQESRALLKETVKAAIPFVVTGSASQFYQLVDQSTFIHLMMVFTNQTRAQLTEVYSYMSANPTKIITIIVSIASSIGGIGIALLIDSYMKKDNKGTARLIINNIQMLLVFLVPALMGAILMARPLYVVFYGPAQPLELTLFIALLLQTFSLSFYAMLSPVMNALYESRAAIRYFILGLVVKVVCQVPFLWLFKAYGPVLSTGLALSLSAALMYRRLWRKVHFNQGIILKNALLVCLNTFIMCLVLVLGDALLGLLFQPTTRLQSLVYLLVIGGPGMAVYGYLSLLTRSLDKILGDRAASLRQKFRMN